MLAVISKWWHWFFPKSYWLTAQYLDGSSCCLEFNSWRGAMEFGRLLLKRKQVKSFMVGTVHSED